jgi:hypothetical protein
MRLESIEHAKFRALAQLEIDPKAGVEAFEDYMKIAFPYLDAIKMRDQKDLMEKLRKEVGRGAIKVTPVMPTKMRSRLKTRMSRRSKPISKDEANSLYEKMRMEYVPR